MPETLFYKTTYQYYKAFGLSVALIYSIYLDHVFSKECVTKKKLLLNQNICCAQKNRLNETVLLSTQNICKN